MLKSTQPTRTTLYMSWMRSNAAVAVDGFDRVLHTWLNRLDGLSQITLLATIRHFVKCNGSAKVSQWSR